MVTDIHERRTREVAAAIAADHPDTTVIGYPMDAGDRAQIDDVVAEVTRTLGPVQILVNNAAVNVIGSIFDYDPENWDWCLRVNLSGPWYLCRAVMPLMRDAGGGVIVNVSSYAADVGGGGIEAPYAITKGGLNVLTRSCAHEGGPFGIRAVTVATGIVTGTKFIDDHPEILDGPGPRAAARLLRRRRRASPRRSPSSRPTAPATSPARSSTSPPARTCGTDRSTCAHPFRFAATMPAPTRPARRLARRVAPPRGPRPVVGGRGRPLHRRLHVRADGRARPRRPARRRPLRLQTGVLGNDYRHPVLVHRMAALLDVVSDGRAGARARRRLDDLRLRGGRDPARPARSAREPVRGSARGDQGTVRPRAVRLRAASTTRCTRSTGCPNRCSNRTHLSSSAAGAPACCGSPVARPTSSASTPASAPASSARDAVRDLSVERVAEKIGWAREGRGRGRARSRRAGARDEPLAGDASRPARRPPTTCSHAWAPASTWIPPCSPPRRRSSSARWRRSSTRSRPGASSSGSAYLQLDAGFPTPDLDAFAPVIETLAGT